MPRDRRRGGPRARDHSLYRRAGLSRGLGGLAIDYSVGGWTFSENGRDLYVSGGDIFNVAGLMAHLSLDPASGALTFVDAVRDEFGPPVPFGGLSGATALGPGETELYYSWGGTMAVFRRDPIAGGLLLLQSLPGSVGRPATIR